MCGVIGGSFWACWQVKGVVLWVCPQLQCYFRANSQSGELPSLWACGGLWCFSWCPDAVKVEAAQEMPAQRRQWAGLHAGAEHGRMLDQQRPCLSCGTHGALLLPQPCQQVPSRLINHSVMSLLSQNVLQQALLCREQTVGAPED